MQRKKYRPPPVHIRFSHETLIGSGGFFIYVHVLCSFTSRTGKSYELWCELKTTTALELTDYLLHPRRIPDDFIDSPSERYRLSRNIAKQLESLTRGRGRGESYKRRGYPTKFKTYKKPA